MKYLILFDIDGTLLRAPGTGRYAIDQAFGEMFGVKSYWGEINAHGRTDFDIINEISNKTLGRSLTEDETTQLIHLFANHFKKYLPSSDKFQVFSGVIELLEYFSNQPDFLIGLQTGNIKQTALAKVEHGKLGQYFQFGGYGCDAIERTKIVSTAIDRGVSLIESSRELLSIVVIGDSVNDVDAGLKNGAKVIAVKTGGESEDGFKKIASDIKSDDLLVLDNLESQAKIISFIFA